MDSSTQIMGTAGQLHRAPAASTHAAFNQTAPSESPQGIQAANQPALVAAMPLWVAVSRGAALAQGTLAWLLFLAVCTGAAPTVAQISGLPTLPTNITRWLLAIQAIALLHFAVRPVANNWWRWGTSLIVVMLFLQAMSQVLMRSQAIVSLGMQAHGPRWLEMQLAACWAIILPGVLQQRPLPSQWFWHGIIAAAGFCAVVIAVPLSWCLPTEPTSEPDFGLYTGHRALPATADPQESKSPRASSRRIIAWLLDETLNEQQLRTHWEHAQADPPDDIQFVYEAHALFEHLPPRNSSAQRSLAPPASRGEQMPIAEVDQQQTLEVEVWLFGPPERQGHARWQCVRAGVQPRVFPSSEHPFQQTEWQDYGQAIARLWWAWLRPLDPGTSPQEK